MFKMDHQQGPTVEHMELCSMLPGSLDRRDYEENDTFADVQSLSPV